MADGKTRRNDKGHYIVGDVQKGGVSRELEIKFVTPVARDIEIAKSELKDDKRDEAIRRKKSYKTTRKAPYKVKKQSGVVDNVF